MTLFKKALLFLSLSSLSPIWAMQASDAPAAATQRQATQPLWKVIDTRPFVSVSALNRVCTEPTYIALVENFLRLREARRALEPELMRTFWASVAVFGTLAVRRKQPAALAQARAAHLEYEAAEQPCLELDRQIRLAKEAIFAEERRAQTEEDTERLLASPVVEL